MNFNFNINRGANNFSANNEFTNYTHSAKKEVNRYLFNGAEDFQKTSESKTSLNALGMMISDIVADVLESASKNSEETNSLRNFDMLTNNSFHRFDEQF